MSLDLGFSKGYYSRLPPAEDAQNLDFPLPPRSPSFLERCLKVLKLFALCVFCFLAGLFLDRSTSAAGRTAIQLPDALPVGTRLLPLSVSSPHSERLAQRVRTTFFLT